MSERTEQLSTPEEISLGQEIAETYRGWRRVDKFLDPANQIEVIETELVEKDFDRVNITSRTDALMHLASLRTRLAHIYSPFADFSYDTISASIMYAHALDGRKFTLNEYARGTIGIEPKPPEDDELKEQKEEVDKAAINAHIEPTPEGYDAHFNQGGLTRKQIKEEFTSSKETSVPIVAEALGLSHLLPLNYVEKFVNLKKAFWRFHSANRRNGVLFELNTASHVRWVKGGPEELAAHELAGHVLQGQSWRQNIRAGIINPGYGILPAPDPVEWQSEGIASTLPFLIPELYAALTPIGSFTVEASYLNRLVMYRLHVMANENYPAEDIKAFVKRFLPYETDGRIERQIEMRTTNPFARCYQLTYCDGAYYFANTAKKLGPEKTIALLKTLYRQPMTPDQVKKVVAELQHS